MAEALTNLFDSPSDGTRPMTLSRLSRFAYALIGLCALTTCAFATAARADDQHEEIPLWPEGHPAPQVAADPKEVVETAQDGTTRRTNISQPRLVHYKPPAGVKRTGAAVIVIPGGGFSRLSDQHEGWEACEWLAKQGVVSFLLLHRTPTHQQPVPNAGPIQDAQKAVSDLRRDAKKYDIDPQKIGVLGFSAGGQVAVIAATNPLTFPVKKEIPSHQPDFLLLIYAYQIYAPDKKALRPEIKLDGKLDEAAQIHDGNIVGHLRDHAHVGHFPIVDKALEIGLVDEMGSMEQAIAKAAELAQLTDYEVVVYPDQKKFIDRIFESLGDAWTPTFLKQFVSWVRHDKESYTYTRLLYDTQF